MRPAAAAASVTPGTHPWEPIVVNRPAARDQRLIRVVAFNARGGRALSKIAQSLRRPPLSHPDIVLLSEMDWHVPRSGWCETAAELATDLGMSFAYIGEFGIARRNGPPISFLGNAILSAWPLADVGILPLSRALIRKRERRLEGGPAALTGTIIVNGRPIVLGVAHLNSRWDPVGRELQMEQFLRQMPPAGPAIIGGDFNTTTVALSSPASFIKVMGLIALLPSRFRHPEKWEPLFDRLREAGFDTTGANVSGAPTFTPSRLMPPLIRPKLDWLALRGLKPISSSALVIPARLSAFGRRFSDHDFIMCATKV
jgi:hypothetical protein